MPPPNPQMQPRTSRLMLNKVPEVTIYFWIAYVLTRPLGGANRFFGPTDGRYPGVDALPQKKDSSDACYR